MDEKDSATILAELREEIRRRRARLGGGGDGATAEPGSAAWSLNELRKSLDEVNDLWFVSAHLPLTWTSPWGHAVAYLRRAIRVFLRWYINPIVEQQNLYNSAVARTLVELTALHDRLIREQQALEERVVALEANPQPPTPNPHA